MPSRAPFRLGLPLSFLLACAACSQEAPPTGDVDVLLLVVDTLRADRLGCYGCERGTSPTLDRIAAEGVRFADCTAQSSWTGPSMVSMLLSRRVASDFVRQPERLPTLAERFHEAGFRTAAVQSNVLLASGSGFERGFEDYLVEPDPDDFEEVLRRDDGRPRFLYVHLVNPHDPYEPAPSFDRFRPRPLDAEVRADFFAIVRAAHPDWPKRRVVLEAERAAAQAARERALYDGEVAMTDAIVGRVLEMLPRPERTIVVVASDHGECLYDHREAPSALAPERAGDPLAVYKRTHNTLLTQELVHVPLLMRGPGLPAGVVVSAAVENVDVHPTLLELCGLGPTPGVDGRSLLPLVAAAARGEEADGRGVVVANTSLFSMARSRAGLKLVVPWSGAGPEREALFDLATDPHERRPLGEDAADPDAVEALRRAVEALRTQGLRARGGEALVDDEVRRRLRELGYLGR